MAKNKLVKEREDVVVRFAGDSGDGMQLIGSLFSDSTAFAGNDFATFPDYPSEIRAPQGTIAGVSGFQVHFGHTDIHTSGDKADVLIAMNPASLKANLIWTKSNGIIIVDSTTFVDKGIEKAGYDTNPLEDNSLTGYTIVNPPISKITLEAVKDLDISNKVALKSKNMFALGVVLYLFNRELDSVNEFFEEKFKSKPLIIEANKRVLKAGYLYAENVEAINPTYKVKPALLKKGLYRNITGNIATAWGLIAAAERSGRQLFLGSYPITPASEILQELSKHKQFSVKAFQAEDEIAGVCSTIGASYTGSLAVTSTSGPGLSLKSEAIGLAVMTELPIVVINVQRGGPSTGMPTKSEQSDLMQALYGRSGESPCIVMAANGPSDCFYSAFEASKLAIEHMTPVILLTDGSIANGSEIFRIPKVANLDEINPPIVEANDPDYQPYKRDEKKLSRSWALPGTEGLRHRLGGLEKENITGNVSQSPKNHQLMVELREEKVERVANYIAEQKVIGDDSGDLLVVSWGGTYGVMLTAVEQLRKKGMDVNLAHFKYINPLPKNTGDVLSRYKHIVVCELNNGQFVHYLKSKFPHYTYERFNKIQGLPFMVAELEEKFKTIIEKNNK